jgi:hypothetical protein
MKISDRAINPTMREEGAWIKNIPEWDGLKLKVRGSGNKDWDALQDTLIRAIPRKRRMVGGLEATDRKRINGLLLLNTSLLDWSGLDDAEGRPEPYSKELARKYLTTPEFEPFMDAVLWAANMVAEIGQQELEEDVGN